MVFARSYNYEYLVNILQIACWQVILIVVKTLLVEVEPFPVKLIDAILEYLNIT